MQEIEPSIKVGLVPTEPSDEQLRAFVDSMLSNLDRLLREPVVIDEAISEHREMWVMLYRASLGFDYPTHSRRAVRRHSTPAFYGSKRQHAS